MSQILTAQIPELCAALERSHCELAAARDQFQAILDAVPGGVSWLDRDLRYLGINKHLASTFGIDPQGFIGQRIGFLNASPEFVLFARALFDSQEESQMAEMSMNIGGEKRHFLIMACKYRGGDSALFVGVDVTTRKLAEMELRYNAFHDKLTGLPNRALFLERLSTSLHTSKTRGDYLFAVLFLDFDGFKTVNDSLGHSVGDKLLQSVARRLEGLVRGTDTVARLGGDEYVLLLDDIDDLSRAIHIAERIHRAMHVPHILDGQEVFLSVSIGITFNTSEYSHTEEILRDADIAMYRAKSGGRNRYEVFDRSMHEAARKRLQLETDLHRSIENHDFLLHFQPILCVKSHRIASFEALLRWNRPVQGFTWPQEFIGVAEETGLIVHLDRWVLRRSCQQMRAWLDEFGAANCPHEVNVNLSSRHFSYPDLVPFVATVLDETGLAPRHLRLEITESALMDNVENVAVQLRDLATLGVRIGLDDFGTGYSSLSYLHRLPLDSLKIDRLFTAQMADSGQNQNLTVVRSIVLLAHGLGLQVVAEGIETQSQLEQLRALNCDFAQGFLFSSGVSADQARELLLHGPILEL